MWKVAIIFNFNWFLKLSYEYFISLFFSKIYVIRFLELGPFIFNFSIKTSKICKYELEFPFKGSKEFAFQIWSRVSFLDHFKSKLSYLSVDQKTIWQNIGTQFNLIFCFCYIWLYFLHCDSLYAWVYPRLNSHYSAWSYKKRKHRKYIYRKSL